MCNPNKLTLHVYNIMQLSQTERQALKVFLRKTRQTLKSKINTQEVDTPDRDKRLRACNSKVFPVKLGPHYTFESHTVALF